MHSFRSLLRLEFKSRYGNSGTNIGVRISQTIPAVLFFGVIYAIYIYGMKIFAEMFHVHDLEYEFLLIFIGLTQLILIAFGISSVNKTLYYSGDNELLLRFPVKGEVVFMAKITFLVILQTAITLAVMLPVLIIYGLEVNAALSYYFMIPFIIVLSVVFPICVANILAIPIMVISNKASSMFWGTLIFNVLFVACGFGLYMGVVQSVVTFMQTQSLSFFSAETLSVLTDILKYLIPFRWFTDLMFGSNLAVSIPCTLASLIVVFGLAMLVVKKLYMSTIIHKLETSTSAFVKRTFRSNWYVFVGKTKACFYRLTHRGKEGRAEAEKIIASYEGKIIPPKNKKHSVYGAVFRREFLDIFRSKNYSFQYLCMAVAGPVMVYFCNRLCLSMGEKSIGKAVLPAICLVVMMLFVTIIVSFAGCCVSKEGDNFYLTKISPVPPHIQVLIKVCLYLVVSFASTLVTAIVIMVSGQVSVFYSLIITGICLMFAIALTCFAVKLDIVKPSFPIGGDGELVNGNFATFITMAVGFVLTIVAGVVGIIMIFFVQSVGFALGMIATVAGALMIASLCWLLIGISKSYEKIMQR